MLLSTTPFFQDRIEEPAQASANYESINQYLREVRRYRLLTSEETESLAFRVHDQADAGAGRQLITANLRLVVRVVMDFQKFWMNNFLDLIQEGNVGLTRAVRKFDPNRGVKFSSYAAYWIRAYVLKFIMDNCRLVKIGTTQAQRKLFYKLNKERKLLESQGIEANSPVLSERLNVKESEIVAMGQRLDNLELSLESPVGADGMREQKVFLSSSDRGVEEDVADREFVVWFHAEIDKLTPQLTERERAILNQRLLSEEPTTLGHIAAQFGLSRERIRQIESGLLQKLRRLFADEGVLRQ